jgi:hypothetical protein
MAVDSNEYPQSYLHLRPSTIAELAGMLAGEQRIRYAPIVAAAGRIIDIECPFSGVLETVKATQVVVGGGAAQNVLDVQLAGVTAYALAADGNTFVGNAAAGTVALAYPTTGLTAPSTTVALPQTPKTATLPVVDSTTRLAFAKGQHLTVDVAGANHGTVLYEIVIAKLAPQTL